MEQTCPWGSFERATVSFCERSLCAWIERPSETWSNLAYIIVGIFILRLASKEGEKFLGGFGVIGIILGICSGIFHATGTFFGEFMDVSAMFLITAFCTTLNLKRLLRFNQRTTWAIFFSFLFSSMGILLWHKPIGISLWGIQCFIAAAVELKLFLQRQKGTINYGYFWKTLASLFGALFIWTLDIQKIVCNPDNHIFTGHAAWHLINSVGLYFLYRFYQQFAEVKA